MTTGTGDGQDDGQDGRCDGAGEKPPPTALGDLAPLTATDPQRIGPYLLLGRLGAGGMGRVYLARSEGGRTVAVKVVHEEHASDPQFRARFRREIDAARRVGERYTAPVLDSAPDADPPWVATGYVPGLTLEQVIRRYGPLPASSVLALADGLLKALEDIHAAGIIHRDLKPSNVMLTVKGPKVIDFGIARALETSVQSLLTSAGAAIGSPGFMSPEQIRGLELGPKSDVFSLGCVLTYAATGQLAFGQGVTNQHAINYHAVVEEPGLDKVKDSMLRALIARCLTKDAAERPDVAALRAPGSGTRALIVDAAWLPAELVVHLADRAAQLLDVDAAPLREEPRDRTTVGLRPPDGSGDEPVLAPDKPGPEPATASGKRERPARRRNLFVVLPVVAVITISGGAVAIIQPWARDSGGSHASGPSDGSGAGATTPAPAGSSGKPSGPASKSPSPGAKASPTKSKGGQGGGDSAQTTGGSAAETGGQPTPATRPTTGTGDSSATDPGSGSGSASGSSGSDSSGSGSSSPDGNAVPSYFVGTWTYADGDAWNQPGRIYVYRTTVGGRAVRFVNDMLHMGHCEAVGQLMAVENSGTRLRFAEAAVDRAKSTGTCYPIKASTLFVGKADGVFLANENTPASGLHYVR
ncbi:protein kinase [Streptomyces sp. NPDC050421]|uniref:protein kinase domain-containing protein n=1 Tax=Streptomyces sp. NPDC050421 TaxID=3365613 RepID=UPI0037A1B617